MDIMGRVSETESISLCEHIRINIKEQEDIVTEYYNFLEIYCKKCDITHKVELLIG